MKQSFNSQLKAIQALVNQVQMYPDSTESARLDCKGEPVSTGAALLTWLRGPDVMREEARRVVSQVWPKLSYDEDMQMHPVAISDDVTIEQLIKAVEERVRNCQSRCARHQTLLQCICPTCQSKSCVECNELLVQVKCSRCQTCITSYAHTENNCLRCHSTHQGRIVSRTRLGIGCRTPGLLHYCTTAHR